MLSRKDFNLLSLWLIYTISFISFTGVHVGGGPSESASLIDFIRAVDPGNSLGISSNGFTSNRCFDRPMIFKCNSDIHSITEIRLENLNLSGWINADSLCKLPSLQVLSLAKNHIIGSIPDSISNCTSLTHLNLSSNSLHGRVPASLTNLKNLRSLDISNNSLFGPVPNFEPDLELVYSITMESNTTDNGTHSPKLDWEISPQPSSEDSNRKRGGNLRWVYNYSPLLLVLMCFVLFVAVSRNRVPKSSEEKEKKVFLQDSPSPIKILTSEAKEETETENEQSELVFFVNEHERFKLEELLGSPADLQGQSFYSTLYKVTLKNNDSFAVKRLKKLQVSMEAFRQMMRWVGSLKHPNLIQLVAYHSSNEDKLLIYRFQRNKSLLYLLENYADGKRDFPWRHRLSIANGIARGLDYIYRKSVDEHVPHGNLKLSNILLNENEEPLISEYGFQRYIDPKRAVLYASNGYKAPEKSLTEKADVYSFGVILLELLTGKTIERTGLDLPKWVRSKVREEWTGEVFDREVNRVGNQWAFPLLNVSLKCVSHLPENRPTIAEVLDKIEEAVIGADDYSFSSASSVESTQRDGCLLQTVIPEGGETPGSDL
ncbi:probable inactive receptor kinase At2g26730 [Magnolia sinica]|uniref:probable inactive receptor kinase At2g26730 n=1 Tax=Magnolia sinica TaxID=86752 RepID=UPI00265A8FE2|nr:probable inactive receptor kinase At2g26730 [Magnolia sinica]